MDQQSPSPSSVSTAFVEQFLEREKEDARRWLRHEMDTLVDSLFGQLRCKFVNCLTQRASSDSSSNSGHHNQYESNYHHHMNYQNSNSSEVQLLASSNYHQFGHQNPKFYHYASNSNYNGSNESNRFNGYNNHQYHHVPVQTIKQEILEEDVLELGPISNSSQSQFYQNQNPLPNPHHNTHPNPPMNPPANNSSIIPLDSYDRFMSSVQQALGLSSESKNSTPIVPSTPTSISNSGSLPPTPILTSPCPSQLSGNSQSVVMQQTSTQNSQLQNLKTYESDDLEDSDCKSCINNLGPYSHNTQVSLNSASLTPNTTTTTTTTPECFLDHNESSNTTQLLDYDNESLDTKPLKRLRIQEDEPDQEDQDANPDDDAQLPFVDVDEDVDSQQGILITLSLKCLQEECPVMFLNKYDLNHHMFEEHGILSNRCQLRDCGQSFGNNLELNDHIHVAHALTTEWHCPKCPKSYKKYIFLYSHMLMSHQEGRFKCAFKDCAFVSENRRQVYIHHNQHQAFGCAFPTCNKTFTQKVNLKAHERTHLKIKPYRCKWPKCRYATERYSSAVNHIRGKHFNLPPTKKEQKERNIVDTRDPKDFLLIVSELLN